MTISTGLELGRPRLLVGDHVEAEPPGLELGAGNGLVAVGVHRDEDQLAEGLGLRG